MNTLRNFEKSVFAREIYIPSESKKYTRLMGHNTASIASILKIRLGLDS